MAVVEEVELEFGPGLNVLTGETGAGKSIILSALQLLSGGRASADAVREGAKEAVIEAVFRTEDLPELEAALAERGIELEEHELIVRRTLSASGRSRAQVAGQLVPVSTLAELFAARIEIASQHGSQALLRPEAHGKLLDAKAGQLELRSKVAERFRVLRTLDEEIQSLRSESEGRARQQDFLAFQVSEIDEAKLIPGESEALRVERGRLVHAERLFEESNRSLMQLAGDSSFGDASNALDLLGGVTRSLKGLAELDSSLNALAERLRGLHAELGDASEELESYASGVEADPSRLAEIEERLNLLENLQRKYGAAEEEILAFRDRIAEELGSIEGADERLEQLEADREAAFRELEKLARQLTKKRQKAAVSFAKEVETALHELELPKAQFAVGLNPLDLPEGFPCAASGAEAPEFLFSANPGQSPRALKRVASGGELSRVFLALKNVLRESGAGMVLVFDEVDTGVGGRTADRVGRVLADLASVHQVLCITHLPQVACLGTTHFRIEKSEVEGRTQTQVRVLEGEARVDEIARMAGGAEITEATRAHARGLIQAGP